MQLLLATAVAIITVHQVHSSTPTTNGGTCTQDDVTINSAVYDETVWANCTNAGATLQTTKLDGAESIQKLCASATCKSFVSLMETKVPNCVLAGDTPANSINLKTAFLMSYGCTPAAAGAPCTLIDTVTMMMAGSTPVWANCSTFLKLDADATIEKVMPDKTANATSLPTGFCTSTCPLFILSVMKALPSCTIGGMNISDPTTMYTLCPNVKPSAASTKSVFLWSYVVLLLTAFATHL
ncbi:hypothetical protein SDRG_10213 [Saprolegnia diclina VS20]|uniref:Elicitin n=1 Tax=Saprolegnia diclina (strain VS20) TaxID=1156394 RepID=T0Q2G8_SAPDV|nr:hypothetical protein SDRG_10213 [Saprolegnia diclina VS20]EQC32014.1 hypothetical protein SDRG_10213 [Saprolegnia diclina VS20]|eukprot:XP_008614416.1 hypothetical protein SDRG_10213 [Saprolegnia diclina VS20]